MTRNFRPATGTDTVPPEHAEAYSEMCHQFALGVLKSFRDASHITIFRDLPMPLQFNAIAVGAAVGGLVPTLMLCDEREDATIVAALRGQMELIVKQARSMANDAKRER